MILFQIQDLLNIYEVDFILDAIFFIYYEKNMLFYFDMIIQFFMINHAYIYEFSFSLFEDFDQSMEILISHSFDSYRHSWTILYIFIITHLKILIRTLINL
jgi:hypothetical protein